MKEYEIVLKYLNGCSGAAHPITTVEEAQASSPEEYLREKHGKDFDKFQVETRPGGQTVYTCHAGPVCYIYEFTEI